MNKTRSVILSLILLILTMPLASAAAGYFDNGDAMTAMQRVTYISFVAISLIFIAMAFFLFMERNDVARRHRPSIGLSVMIVGIAGFQYILMQEVYLIDGSIPTDYRYADWLTTVPIMAVVFAILPGKETFTDKRLFSLPGMSVPGIIVIGSLFMMINGYVGQVDVDSAIAAGTDPGVVHWFWFFFGMLGFMTVVLVVGTPFTGAYGIDDSKIKDPAIKLTMDRLRKLVIYGWLIYPVGYIIGALDIGGNDVKEWMVIVYNIADLINKVGFVVIVLIGTRGTVEANLPVSVRVDGFAEFAEEESSDNSYEEYDDSGLAELSKIAQSESIDIVDDDDDM